MNNDKRLSLAISSIRFPLAILIVLAHANPFKFPYLIGNAKFNLIENWIHYPITFVAWSIFSSAVPLFFAISGYLFFVKIEFFSKRVYFDKLKSRFYSLVIPYMVWNMTFVFYLGLWRTQSLIYLENLFMLFVGSPKDNVVNMVMSCPVDLPLWFVRDLIGAVLLSPLVYFGVKKPKYGIIVFVILLFLVYRLFSKTILDSWFFCTLYAFFRNGCLFGRSQN